MDKKIKNTFSNIHPSDECIERIFEMPKKTNTKKRIKLSPALALVAVFAIIVTGAFGGTAINARLNPVETTAIPIKSNNFFAITAYAHGDNGEKKIVDLKDNEITKTDVKIEFDWEDPATTGSDCAVHVKSENGFIVKGENIRKVTYSSKNGTFSYAKRAAEESFDVQGDFGEFEGSYIPTASKLTITAKDGSADEFLEIYYNPDYATDVLLKSKDDDYTKLPGDTIIVRVEFKDGSYGEQAIKTSFDKDGYVLMEYVK